MTATAVRPPWLPKPDDPDELVLFRRGDVPEVVRSEPPDGSIEARFRAFHAANPWVLDALERLAADLLGRGHRRLGIGQLWEVLRWQHGRVSELGESPALNNDHRSRYARLLIERHPDWVGAFETRRLRAP